MSDSRAAETPVPADDELLVDRAKTERAAFAALFDRYYPRVAQYCLRRLNDRTTAEDVTSEVFLQVASHMPRFAGTTETDFRRWLFRIATNAIAAQQRHSARRVRLWKAAAERGQFDRTGAAHPFKADHDRLDWPAVAAAIAELEARDQTIVSLRFFADCSHDEIAAIVGSSVGAVRTALARALARLRGKLNVNQAPD